MLLLNYLLYASTLLSSISRRSLFQIGVTNIMMKNIDNTNKYNYNYKYTIPELDSDSESNTIIHVDNCNLYFQGTITPESCFYLQQHLINLQNSDNEKINFYIQSVGGSLLPAFGVIDTIKSSSIPVNTYINGYVASAGSLLSVSGNKRYMSKNSMMLIHSLRTTIGEVNFQELEDHYLNSASMMNIVKNIYQEKAQISEEHLDYLLRHDYWLNSSECLKYNFIDEII